MSSARSRKLRSADGEMISKRQFPAIAGARGEKHSVRFWQICPKHGFGGSPTEPGAKGTALRILRERTRREVTGFRDPGQGDWAKQDPGASRERTCGTRLTERAQRKCPHGTGFAATRGGVGPGAAGRRHCPRGDLGACGPASSLHVSQASLNRLPGWYRSKSWASSCEVLTASTCPRA